MRVHNLQDEAKASTISAERVQQVSLAVVYISVIVPALFSSISSSKDGLYITWSGTIAPSGDCPKCLNEWLIFDRLCLSKRLLRYCLRCYIYLLRMLPGQERQYLVCRKIKHHRYDAAILRYLLWFAWFRMGRNQFRNASLDNMHKLCNAC